MKFILALPFFFFSINTLFAQSDNGKIRLAFSSSIKKSGDLILYGNGNGQQVVFQIQSIILKCDSAKFDIHTNQYSFMGVDVYDTTNRMLVQCESASIKSDNDSVIISGSPIYMLKALDSKKNELRLDSKSLVICFQDFKKEECIDLDN